MKKIYATLLLFIGIVNYSNAQNWPHVGTSGLAVNPLFGIYSSDLLVVSETEMYVAAFQMNNGAGEKSLKVNKFDGTNWVSMGEVIANFTVGTIIMRKAPDGSIYLAYSKLNTQNLYELMLMKYDGSKWQNIAPMLNLPSSLSYFDFVIDNNNVPIILGSKALIIEASRVSKFENNAWSHTPIPNSAGSVFNVNSCFVSPQNEFVYTWQKTQVVNGVLEGTIFLDTLTGTTFTSGTEKMSGKIASSNQLLRDGNNNIIIVNTESIPSNSILTLFKQVNGEWTKTSRDTTGQFLLFNFTTNANGQILCSNSSSKVFLLSNFGTPLYDQSTPFSTIYKLKALGGKVFALVNNGVIVGDISSGPNGIESTSNLSFGIYPNPSSTSININNVDVNSIEQISIFDVQGKKILQTSNVNNILVEEFNSGIYFVEMLTKDGKVGRTKFIKE